jgi:hypothetical protein
VALMALRHWIAAVEPTTYRSRGTQIRLFPIKDRRPPYPLSREEQAVFFPELPDYLCRMALFK